MLAACRDARVKRSRSFSVTLMSPRARTLRCRPRSASDMDSSNAPVPPLQAGGPPEALLQPARLMTAVRAGQRLKLYLAAIEAAVVHVRHPHLSPTNLAREIRAVDIAIRADAEWLADLPATASLHGDSLRLPELPRLATSLHDDLATMVRPLQDESSAAGLRARVAHWLDELASLQTASAADMATVDALTVGRSEPSDSLQRTVSDLLLALEQMAGARDSETVAGAHVAGPGVEAADVGRIEAFMRGVDRTRALKLEHPGLEASVARAGNRLTIRVDIGSRDALPLVVEVDTSAMPAIVSIEHADAHRQRLGFFQRQMESLGATWHVLPARRVEGAEGGQDFSAGVARFEPRSEPLLMSLLEGIGERLVFLIDWNRARGRLLSFTDKAGAVAVLEEAARRHCGHRAWLSSGGERLLWNAMGAQPGLGFRLGDRLDEVLGPDVARAWLVDVMAVAWRLRAQGQPVALAADEARALLARRLQGRQHGLEQMAEHVALVHALVQALREALSHGQERDDVAAAELAARAKAWERQADQLVMRARDEATRHAGRRPLLVLLEAGDDVADAIEEACFMLMLLAEHFAATHGGPGRQVRRGWSPPVRQAVGALADTLLQAVQDMVKAVAIARAMGDADEPGDHDEFLGACWRVLQAERQCDTLLRHARRAMAQEARERQDAVAMQLGIEFAAALEQASDALLRQAHALRDRLLRPPEAAHA